MKVTKRIPGALQPQTPNSFAERCVGGETQLYLPRLPPPTPGLPPKFWVLELSARTCSSSPLLPSSIHPLCVFGRGGLAPDVLQVLKKSYFPPLFACLSTPLPPLPFCLEFRAPSIWRIFIYLTLFSFFFFSPPLRKISLRGRVKNSCTRIWLFCL